LSTSSNLATFTDYKMFIKLVSIGIQARIPMHFVGYPGTGKTELTKSLAKAFTDAGQPCRVYVLIGSIREPQDFGGFPIQTPEGVRLAPMQWAREANEYANKGYLVIVFLDELTTVPPTTQAAMLRLLAENVCGELELHPNVRFVAASNQVEWAAGGQEIQPPMANRMWHGEMPFDHNIWCDMMMMNFPTPEIAVIDPEWEQKYHPKMRRTIAAYIKSKGRGSLLAPPEDSDKRSGPWPSNRSWYLVSRFLAAIEAYAPGDRQMRSAAITGLVGNGEALSFLQYEEQLDLPDPEEVLKDPKNWDVPKRADRLYAACHGVAGAVMSSRGTKDFDKRWMNMMVAFGVAAKLSADVPASVARMMCEKNNRPDKLPKLPPECRPWMELMQMAGLIPKE
jgi:hypothetical protein